MGDWASVGGEVSEMRIHFGSGYRLYFTRRGRTLIIMLALCLPEVINPAKLAILNAPNVWLPNSEMNHDTTEKRSPARSIRRYPLPEG